MHSDAGTWEILVHESFEDELRDYDRRVRNELFSAARLLALHGPQLGRPHVDTLKGSKHANMKELRFEAADGEWRAAFAFDPDRKAILLVAGDKSGTGEKLFYKRMIAKADLRFSEHLEILRSFGKGN